MRKSDKKIENQLRTTLTEVCEDALKHYDGFQWLTHIVHYDNFPKSLQIVCIFDSNDQLAKFKNSKSYHQFMSLIQAKLFGEGIVLKKIFQHIVYDTEENCNQSHDGKWHERLQCL